MSTKIKEYEESSGFFLWILMLVNGLESTFTKVVLWVVFGDSIYKELETNFYFSLALKWELKINLLEIGM